MLLKNYQEKRSFHNLWAIILFIISTTTAIFLSYFLQKNNILPHYDLITCLNYWDVLSIFCLYILTYAGAILILYTMTVPVMYITPISFLFIPHIIQYFNGDKPSKFASSLFVMIIAIIIYFYYVYSNIKYVAPVIQLSIKIICQNLPIIILGIIPISSLALFISLRMYLLMDMISTFALIFMLFNILWSCYLIYHFTYVFISSLICFKVRCHSGYHLSAVVNTLYALGSLALASLIATAIYIIRIIGRRFGGDYDDDNPSCNENLEMLNYLFGDIVNYLNEWAFIYIALMGVSYVSACKRAFTELYNNPTLTIINNSCLICLLSVINVAIFYGFHILFCTVQSKLIGVFFGLLLTMYMTISFDCANKTLIILYSVDTEALGGAYDDVVRVFNMQLAENEKDFQ